MTSPVFTLSRPQPRRSKSLMPTSSIAQFWTPPLSSFASMKIHACGFVHSSLVTVPVKLTGTVTKLEWTNPHAWIFIDAKDDKGGVQNWAIELVGINDLLRRGWGRDKVKTGDVINVDGFGAKTSTNIANASSVTLASTGELLWASVPRSGQN